MGTSVVASGEHELEHESEESSDVEARQSQSHPPQSYRVQRRKLFKGTFTNVKLQYSYNIKL